LSNILSPSLQNNVVGSNTLGNSIEWEFRDNVEWSVDMETKFFVKSLGFSFCLLVKVEDLPSLICTIMSVVNLNCLTFDILVADYIKTSVLLVNVTEVLLSKCENLEPLRVGTPDLHVIGSSR
jgi:hypothetical protein